MVYKATLDRWSGGETDLVAVKTLKGETKQLKLN